jgi:hypothetical protein
MSGPTAPGYENVQLPGSGGIRVPTEVYGSNGAGKAGASFKLNKSVTHDFGAAHADYTLLPAETQASEIIATDASAAANVIWPAAFPGHYYVVYNNSGFTVTFKVTGQTGVAVANGKRCILVCEATDIARVTPDT